MRVAGRSDAQGTELTLDGTAAVGRIEMPPGARHGVTAQFERLHLPESTSDAPPTAVDPAALPPIHFWARDARLGEAELGEIRIETYPQGAGMHLERIEANSPNLELRGRGDWVVAAGVQHTTMDVTFTAESLGRMLDTLGYVGLVEGGQTFARVQGRWAGTPSQFSLARMQGTLELKVGRGRIVQVDPGAGRLFGLLNLSEVPRRLSLDFSDLFQSGLSFDAIEGQFQLRGGSAYTTDLLMRGPSADIVVSGRTGLADRDYDQELLVKPRLGGVLPVVGALAAGPVGVAAGLVAQGVLSDPDRSHGRGALQGDGQLGKARHRAVGAHSRRARAQGLSGRRGPARYTTRPGALAFGAGRRQIPGTPSRRAPSRIRNAMTQALSLATARLLAPVALDTGDLERVFARLMGRGIDRADLYFQHSRYESWSLEDGIVKDGTHSIEQGVGVRAISGEKSGFAYSDEIALPQLVEASGAARAIARSGADGRRAGPGRARAARRCTRRRIRSTRSRPSARSRCCASSTPTRGRSTRA